MRYPSVAEYVAKDAGRHNTISLLAQWRRLSAKIDESSSSDSMSVSDATRAAVRTKAKGTAKVIAAIAKADGQVLKNSLLEQTRAVEEMLSAADWKKDVSDASELSTVLAKARAGLLGPGQGVKFQAAWKKLAQASSAPQCREQETNLEHSCEQTLLQKKGSQRDKERKRERVWPSLCSAT